MDQSESLKQLTTLPPQISLPTNLSRFENSLRPASATAGNAELLACLTLVAPTGMTAEDRNAWVQVARATLSGMPGDLLAAGCKAARRTCKFPSEIVPAIVEYADPIWASRERSLQNARRAYLDSLTPRIARTPPEPIPREETQRILREVRQGTRA